VSPGCIVSRLPWVEVVPASCQTLPMGAGAAGASPMGRRPSLGARLRRLTASPLRSGDDADEPREPQVGDDATATGLADRSGADQDVIDGLVALGTGLPFNRHLGVEVRHIQPGRCVTALPANEQFANHLGGVHAIAELAPVELAGALALSSRLTPLLRQGYVPVVGGLQVRYRAPANGELLATAEVGPDVLATAEAAIASGDRPRFDVEVAVTDTADTVVAVAELRFVYLAVDAGA
jgi:acyl-coenzyme A thioesterase PaaI-like protein